MTAFRETLVFAQLASYFPCPEKKVDFLQDTVKGKTDLLAIHVVYNPIQERTGLYF